MTPRRSTRLALDTLFASTRGALLPLPRRLAQLYGPLRMPQPGARPHVFSNFVSTLDGVVSFGIKGHASGGDISGFSAQDRMVMGMLRAVADIVIVGAGTLGADRRHVWTAQAIYPALASDYHRLSEAMGKRGPPLNVIVSGSGNIDLGLPIFSAGAVPVLVITTTEGAQRLRRQRKPDAVGIRVVRRRGGSIPARAILACVARVNPGKLILVEGGPRLLGDFYAEGLVDEQFLTLAPQVAGRSGSRDTGSERPSLAMGQAFAPGSAPWGTLIDARRGGSHLYLRYAFPGPGAGRRPRRT